MQVRNARSDTDVVIEKMKDDVAKVMEELTRVQGELHTAQNYIASIEPDAAVVRGIREKQARWDAEHAAIEAGHDLTTGAHIGAFAKLGAQRKLGPRPSLTL